MNRLSCTLALEHAGIPVPATVVTQDLREARAAVKRFGEAVLKPIYSTKARGMVLVRKGDKELKQQLQAFNELNPLIYVQQRVRLPGRDLGVVFLGGEYLGSYARVAAKGSWATTIRAGGHYESADPSPTLIELARRAQALFKLDFASVDVAQTPDGPVVLGFRPEDAERVEAIAQASSTPRGGASVPTYQDGNSPFNGRLRLADHALEVNILTLVRRNGIVPERPHGFDIFIAALAAAAELHAHGVGLLFHPAHPDAQKHPTTGEAVEAGKFFGQNQGVTLGEDQDASSQSEGGRG